MLGWALNLGFAGSSEAVAETTPARSPGGRYVYIPDYPERKFTKKDEEELKRLLLKAVEEETGKAHAELQQKAIELRKVSEAAAGIKTAVDKAQQTVRRQAMQNRLNWIEAQRRIEELEEEEDLLLILAAL